MTGFEALGEILEMATGLEPSPEDHRRRAIADHAFNLYRVGRLARGLVDENGEALTKSYESPEAALADAAEQIEKAWGPVVAAKEI